MGIKGKGGRLGLAAPAENHHRRPVGVAAAAIPCAGLGVEGWGENLGERREFEGCIHGVDGWFAF